MKAAFNKVSQQVLSRRLGELGIVPDLIRWTDSFMSDRRVKFVLEGREGEEYEVETGVPQGWCDPENISGTQQTRDHLFKHCSMWKDKQAELWARGKEATKRAQQKRRVGDLLADERCSPAVLDFLRELG